MRKVKHAQVLKTYSHTHTEHGLREDKTLRTTQAPAPTYDTTQESIPLRISVETQT